MIDQEKLEILAKLQHRECPLCGDKELDLQSKNYGVVWWCGMCRKHFIESDYQSEG